MAVTYEAGPTGFGLARALDAAGIWCQVAAPSKLIRPGGDRIKTDTRDAPGSVSVSGPDHPVTVLTAAHQEVARDLMRPGRTAAVI